MISEERVGQILARPGELEGAAQALINEANQAGGRDNITVVLVRLEDVPSSADGTGDQPTAVGMAPPTKVTSAADSAATAGAAGVASAAIAGTTTLPKDGADTAAPPLEPERAPHETEPAPAPRAAGPRGGV